MTLCGSDIGTIWVQAAVFSHALILMGRKPLCELKCGMTPHAGKVTMCTNASPLPSRRKKPEIIGCKWDITAPWVRVPARTIWRPGRLIPIPVKREGMDNYCHVREERRETSGFFFFFFIQDNTYKYFSLAHVNFLCPPIISLFKKQQTKHIT